MAERSKVLYVSRTKEEKRAENLKRILGDYGTQLRMNRSIQAEGTFAVVKEDMGFRQYLYRGMKNVLAESVLVAIAYNINKLHWKIQSQKTGIRLLCSLNMKRGCASGVWNPELVQHAPFKNCFE